MALKNFEEYYSMDESSVFEGKEDDLAKNREAQAKIKEQTEMMVTAMSKLQASNKKQTEKDVAKAQILANIAKNTAALANLMKTESQLMQTVAKQQSKL